MTPALLAVATALLVVGAACAAAGRADPARRGVACAIGGFACALGAGASLALLASGGEQSWRVAWSPPIDALSVGVDPLSAFFLLCVFVVGGLAVLYAAGYFAHAAADERTGSAIAWLQVLIAAMALVVLARDVIVFLVAWEAMFLSSYFLVAFDDRAASVRSAAFTYLVASHVGVVLLFVLFGLLVRSSGSTRFADFAAAPLAAPTPALCFAAALAGFGIKAGLWPLHGWLPDAHPAAPSPVSALMSGVMIKMGIYGLLRTLTFLGPPSIWWGIALLALGGLSALAGLLMALAQDDLKRLLAYSSVENVGIIATGIGIGLLGRTVEAPAVAIAGFAGALLHTLNHGLFKGLLFEVAGAVAHATGTRSLSALGGLLHRMPTTGALFLAGAIAISGLPPLNGFASEWLIYVGALRLGVLDAPLDLAVVGLLAVPVLALVGGLAAACFTGAFGTAFLGQPRSPLGARAHEVKGAMRLSMMLGATACVAIGVAPAAALELVIGPASQISGAPVAAAAFASSSLGAVSLIAAILVGAILLIAAGRALLLRRREIGRAPTWDCGYAAPTARMQYSASSFAEPVLDPFLALLRVRAQRTPVAGLFPQHAAEDVRLEDPGDAAARLALGALVAPLGRLRALQQGPVQLYLLYVLITLLVLLVWQVSA